MQLVNCPAQIAPRRPLVDPGGIGETVRNHDLAPRERSGEFLGVWRLIADSGGVAAPALVGALAQAFTLGAAFVACAAIGVLGAGVLAFLVPEGLRRIDAPAQNSA